MNQYTRFKTTRSQRQVSLKEQCEEIVVEFPQQPESRTTEGEGMVTQDNAQLAKLPQPIAGLLKSEE